MQLRNHIAYRFLTDITFLDEIMETCLPYEWNLLTEMDLDLDRLPEQVQGKIVTEYDLIDFKDQKAYYITDTVLDKLDMLKVSKPFDWTVFKHVEDCRITFIFRKNRLLRMRIYKHMISFVHIEFNYHPKEKQTKHEAGQAHFIHFFVDRNTGEQCDHFNHVDLKGPIETMVYHLLCFFYLSENTERIVSAGKSWGTKKQPDALSNDLPVPVTIVNSNWNVTSIRKEGFGVSGHFRLQPCGWQLSQAKMVFIEPYQKHGYIRRAAKPE